MSIPIFQIVFIIQPILSIVGKVLFSMWIYKDAKRRNLQSVWWIVGVVFVSWIALVIYMIYSKDKPEGAFCPACNTYNFHNGDYCVNCGNQVVKQKNNDKGLLYGGVAAIIISIILGVIFAVIGITGYFFNYAIYDSGYDSYTYEYTEPFINSYYHGINTDKISA